MEGVYIHRAVVTCSIHTPLLLTTLPDASTTGYFLYCACIHVAVNRVMCVLRNVHERVCAVTGNSARLVVFDLSVAKERE